MRKEYFYENNFFKGQIEGSTDYTAVRTGFVCSGCRNDAAVAACPNDQQWGN